MDEARAFVQAHRPVVLEDECPPIFLLATISSHAAHASGWFAVRHVFVEPTDTVNGLSDMPTPDDRPGVSFFHGHVDRERLLFPARPFKDQMDKLTELFKKPCWMKDALDKEMWHEYYHFSV